MLNFNKEVMTSRGNSVKIYHVYRDYMHGAWLDEPGGMWIVASWTLSGYYLGKQHNDDLDLVNVD